MLHICIYSLRVQALSLLLFKLARRVYNSQKPKCIPSHHIITIRMSSQETGASNSSRKKRRTFATRGSSGDKDSNESNSDDDNVMTLLRDCTILMTRRQYQIQYGRPPPDLSESSDSGSEEQSPRSKPALSDIQSGDGTSSASKSPPQQLSAVSKDTQSNVGSSSLPKSQQKSASRESQYLIKPIMTDAQVRNFVKKNAEKEELTSFPKFGEGEERSFVGSLVAALSLGKGSTDGGSEDVKSSGSQNS